MSQPESVVVCTRTSGECCCSSPGEMKNCNMSQTIEVETFGGIPIASGYVATATGTPQPPPDTVLDEAMGLTDRTRKDVYAHPSVNFDRIARMWSVILGCEVTPEQHALCMIAVKLSRLIETPGHRDSLVDIAGYARTIELLGEVNP